MIRSWLFVPGDSEKKIRRAFDSEADAVIFDWEDAVAPSRKVEARRVLSEFLERAPEGGPQWYIRVNGYDTSYFEEDIQALPVTERLKGIVVPKACGPRGIEEAAKRLDDWERQTGRTLALSIVAVATENASSVMALTDFRQPVPRLQALMWGAEDLSADMGVPANRDDQGNYKAVFSRVQELVLFAAAAAQCVAIDAVYVNYRNPDGLLKECQQARSSGFSSKAAIHPDQISIINRAFGATKEEQEWARRVVEALDLNSGVGTVDGKMVDAPHLRLALRILGRTA